MDRYTSALGIDSDKLSPLLLGVQQKYADQALRQAVLDQGSAELAACEIGDALAMPA